jgi:hypothetical protein
MKNEIDKIQEKNLIGVDHIITYLNCNERCELNLQA